MKTVYTVGANGSSPALLAGVLAAHGVTHLFDIRRTPNHHFSNVQGRFLEALLPATTGIHYERASMLAPPRLSKKQLPYDQPYFGKIGSGCLAEAARLIEKTTVPCFLGSQPYSSVGSSYRNTLLAAVSAESSGSLDLQHLEGIASYKRIVQSFDLHEGTAYDIKTMFEELNDKYFDARYSVDDVVLVWEQMRRVRPRVLGRFRYPNVIALNPVLDQEIVPKEIAEAVLYHELVHLRLAHDGLPFGHTVEFFQREAEFADYARKFHFDFAQSFAVLDAVAEDKE